MVATRQRTMGVCHMLKRQLDDALAFFTSLPFLVMAATLLMIIALLAGD
jgi:hypothetical protein